MVTILFSLTIINQKAWDIYQTRSFPSQDLGNKGKIGNCWIKIVPEYLTLESKAVLPTRNTSKTTSKNL